jgi:thiol-disulfide isomerase/thioredoxin
MTDAICLQQSHARCPEPAAPVLGPATLPYPTSRLQMPPLPPDLPPATLEVFYSPTCTPCRLELPAVAEIAGRDGVRVRVVILDDEDRARAELREVSTRLEAVAESKVGEAPNAVLRDAGNNTGILPYARSVTANGDVCAKWSGRLTVARARSLLAACSRIIPSPGHSRS